MSYFITDPKEFGNHPIEFENSLTVTLSTHDIDMICFRDKISPNTRELAKVCLKVSKKFNIKKILINSDIELCNELGFDGIHLNSLQFNLLEELTDSSLFTMISCHTESEVIKAKTLKANAITYSPIFFKEDKGKPKGIENLKEMVVKHQSETFDIFALGGIISKQHIKKIMATDARGFASIRYFKV